MAGFGKSGSTEENEHKQIAVGIDLASKICNQRAFDAGWWDKPREVGTCLALIHSEISEALEGDRKDKDDEHLPHHKSITVELADAIIRICDLAGHLKLPLGQAVGEKMAYNLEREDHKRENRAKEGGKKY